MKKYLVSQVVDNGMIEQGIKKKPVRKEDLNYWIKVGRVNAEKLKTANRFFYLITEKEIARISESLKTKKLPDKI